MRKDWEQVLVPYDFSHCSSYALEVGIQLAKRFDADLHVVTVLDIPDNWLVLSDKERAKYPEAKERIKQAQLLMKEKQEEADRRGVVLQWRYMGGRIITQISEYAEMNHIDLIVMGSHGTSGKSEFFIGSNTQKVIRTVHIPLLVVKRPVEEFSLKKVVFASDFNKREKEAFEVFLSFVSPFEPEIHLVAVNTTGFFNQPYVVTKSAMEDFCQQSVPLKCETHFFSDLNVEAGIRHFSEEFGADLVAISNHFRSPVRRLFSGSKVETLANHADIPVLSIDYEEEQ